MGKVEQKIAIGKIIKPFGVKGEMVILPLTEFKERFFELKSVFVSNEIESKEFEVQNVRELNHKILLQLKEIKSPEEVKKLKGSFLEVSKTKIFPLPKGNYYVFDMIGLSVFDTFGKKIGEIKEVLSFPANDVYVVKTERKEVDIPAIKEIVKEIDLKNKRMVIKVIDGLLE